MIMTDAWFQPLCFDKPDMSALLLSLMPLTVLLGYGFFRESRIRRLLADALMEPKIMPPLRRWVVFVRRLMLFFSFLFLCIALTGPALCNGVRPVLRDGPDVLFMLDVSRSMMAADLEPNRLEQARQEIRKLVAQLHGGRNSLLLFAGKPLAQCPMTSDREAFEGLLGMASPSLIEEQGTGFRQAFEHAGSLLFPDGAASDGGGMSGEKMVVLLSDGEDHDGDFIRAAQAFRQHGIHLFVIGVGSRQPAQVPFSDTEVMVDQTGQPVMSLFREEVLQSLARESGALYFRSRAGQMAADAVAAKINQVAAASRWVMEPAEHESLVSLLLLLALLSLVAEMLVGHYFSRNASLRL